MCLPWCLWMKTTHVLAMVSMNEDYPCPCNGVYEWRLPMSLPWCLWMKTTHVLAMVSMNKDYPCPCHGVYEWKLSLNMLSMNDDYVLEVPSWLLDDENLNHKCTKTAMSLCHFHPCWPVPMIPMLPTIYLTLSHGYNLLNGIKVITKYSKPNV